MPIDGGASINLVHRKVVDGIMEGLGSDNLHLLKLENDPLAVRVANTHVWFLDSSVQLTVYGEHRPVVARF